MDHLDQDDEIKFVIASRADYEWSRDKTRELDLSSKVAAVQFSPAWGLVDPADLADWLVEDRLDARLQIQLHKVLWNPDARGV